jgi:hypothetical protein
MKPDETGHSDILGWFLLRDGQWLRLSRENHGGRDSVQLRVCKPDPSAVGHRHWQSPAGPMRPTDIGLSLERAVWRRIATALRTAFTKPVMDTSGLPFVTLHARHLSSQGHSVRQIADATGISKSQVHRLLREWSDARR